MLQIFRQFGERYLVLLSLLIYFVMAVIWEFTTDAPWDDDCIARYLNTRDAFNNPANFISLWNRPLFVLIFSIPFQLGRHAILLMSLLTAGSAYLLYLAIKEQGKRNAWMVVPLMLFQTFFFVISKNALVEPLAAILLSAAYYLLVKRKMLLFAIAGGLLPLARLELSPLLIFWVLALIKHREAKQLIWLAVPVAVWSLAGTVIEGETWWLYDQLFGREADANIYGHTTFGHYFQRFIYVIGPVVFYFFMIGLSEDLYHRKFNRFIHGVFVVAFFIYVLFSWKMNLGQAAGFLRHLAVIAPMIAIIALSGINYWTDAAGLKATKAGSGDAGKNIGFPAIRVAAYSLILVVLSYFFFSGKLQIYQLFNHEKDYFNLYYTIGLTVLFVFSVLIAGTRIKLQGARIVHGLIVASMIAFIIVNEPPDAHKSEERTTMNKSIDYYFRGKLQKYPLYVNHVWFFWKTDQPIHGKRISEVTRRNLLMAPDSSIVFWENHYSQRLAGDVNINFFKENREYLELYHEFSADLSFMVRVFQKIKGLNSMSKIKVFDHLIAKLPDATVAYLNRGEIKQHELEDMEGALADFNKAIIIDPGFNESYFKRGMLFYALGNYEQAIRDLLKCIELDSRYANVYFNVSACFAKLGQPEKAIEFLTREIAVNPGYVDAYFNRAILNAKLHYVEQALTDLDKVLELNPGHVTSMEAKGEILVNIGRREEGCKLIQRALARNGTNARRLYEQFCK